MLRSKTAQDDTKPRQGLVGARGGHPAPLLPPPRAMTVLEFQLGNGVNLLQMPQVRGK